MTGFSLIRALRFMAACLLFYLPLAVWFVLGISGNLDGITQERFDHVSGMIAIGCSALFLIIGIPVVLPRAWNGVVSEKGLLKRGRPARGFLRSVKQSGEEPSGAEAGVEMLLEVEIVEPDGRYLTEPQPFSVPPDAASMLRTGMELPLRVNPGDRYSYTVNWSLFLKDRLKR